MVRKRSHALPGIWLVELRRSVVVGLLYGFGVVDLGIWGQCSMSRHLVRPVEWRGIYIDLFMCFVLSSVHVWCRSSVYT